MLPTQEFKKYFTDCLKKELIDHSNRVEKLRVSGFPYCGLQHCYKKLTHDGSLPTNNFGLPFYTGVGTVVHEVLQRYLGQGRKIYGNWKCLTCDTTVECSNKSKCPNCSAEMQYEEFEVHAFKHLSGHLDGIYKAKDGKYYVIDYKTSSVRNIYKHRKYGVFPYAKNRAQISAYCALIEEEYDIEISGWMLIYVARDNPMIVEVVGDTLTTKQKARILKMCKGYDDQYEVVCNIKSFKDIEHLIDVKPCNNREYYQQHYKGIEGCPLESVCFTKKLRQFMKEQYFLYKEDTKKSR